MCGCGVLLQVFGSNVLPLSKQDKIDGSVSARVKLVYFELLCAPIGQEHREHVAIMCWGPTRTKFDEILVGGDPVSEPMSISKDCRCPPQRSLRERYALALVKDPLKTKAMTSFVLSGLSGLIGKWHVSGGKLNADIVSTALRMAVLSVSRTPLVVCRAQYSRFPACYLFAAAIDSPNPLRASVVCWYPCSAVSAAQPLLVPDPGHDINQPPY